MVDQSGSIDSSREGQVVTVLEQFMALYDTPVDAEGMATGNATIVDWPVKD